MPRRSCTKATWNLYYKFGVRGVMGTIRTIEELKDAVDPLSVYRDYVRLTRKGKRSIALCPFHKERTPSFSVDGENGLFYCFGCHKGGDVIQFLQEMESCDFHEAVELLAGKGGVSFEFHRSSGAKREPKSDHKERLRALLQAASTFYAKAFSAAPPNSLVKRYCASRSILPETAEALQIGWAPSSGGLLAEMARRGFTADESLEAGLVFDRGQGRWSERFRDRLIFPIRDLMGRTVGFGGRTLGDGEPKYLNSPESDLFQKRRLLFGMDLSKGAVREKGKIVIVEGYMDFLAVYQAGIRNVAATLGTALSEDQVRLIGRYAREAVLNFDQDAAGIDAARRAIKLLLTADIGVKVLVAPESKDPDEFIGRNGPEAYRKLVEKAESFFNFLLERQQRAVARMDAEGKRTFIDGFTEYLRVVADPIERQEYAKEIAGRTGIALGLILERIEEVSPRRSGGPSVTVPAEAKLPVKEQILVKGLLAFPESGRRLIAALPDETLAAMVTGPLLHVLLNGGLPEEPGQTSLLARIEHGCHEVPTERDLRMTVAGIGAEHLKERDREIQRQIKEATVQKDFGLIRILTREKVSLLNELQSLERSVS